MERKYGVKFQVGDKVMVRPDIKELADEPPGVTIEMEAFAGKVVTIREETRNGIVRLVEDPDNWAWRTNWLVASPYKVGDYIRVKPTLEFGQPFHHIQVTSTMVAERGKVHKISCIKFSCTTPNTPLYELDGCPYWFTQEMIEDYLPESPVGISKLRIGDSVVFNRMLEVDKSYGGVRLLETMPFEGVKRIEAISEAGNYCIEGFFYSAEMLIKYTQYRYDPPVFDMPSRIKSESPLPPEGCLSLKPYPNESEFKITTQKHHSLVFE